MISAKICQKIIILSATWFRRKSEEGSDACNTDCGSRVGSKQRSVTAWSTVETKFCRYTELIRLCFQHKWIASLGAVSTVLCAPLQISENQSEVLHLFRWYTHTLQTRIYDTAWTIPTRCTLEVQTSNLWDDAWNNLNFTTTTDHRYHAWPWWTYPHSWPWHPRPKALFFGLGMGASPKTRKILWYWSRTRCLMGALRW